jgi:hypothetical protein
MVIQGSSVATGKKAGKFFFGGAVRKDRSP